MTWKKKSSQPNLFFFDFTTNIGINILHIQKFYFGLLNESYNFLLKYLAYKSDHQKKK